MKKIYFLTAVLALLTLSLNAQTTYQKVTSTDDLTNGEYLIVSEAYSKAFNGSLEGSALNSNSNPLSVTINDGQIASNAEIDAATFTIDFTAGTIKSASGYYIGQTSDANGMVYSQTEAYTNTITLNTTSTNVDIIGSGGAYLRYNNGSDLFRYYKSSTYENQKAVRLFKKITSATTAELTAPTNGSTVNVGTNTGSGVSKEITVSGSNLTADLTVSVSGTGFSVSPTTITAANANAGTTVTVTYNGTVENATGTLTISSSEVSTTVNLTATYNSGTTPSGGTLTVCDGGTTTGYLPVYGLWYDSETGQKNQMIYNASLLTDMVGSDITSMTFYAPSGIGFSDGSVTYSLGTTSSNTFSSSTALTDNVTAVATVVPNGETEWLITFSTPYPYNGGNLLIQVDTETGDYASTDFTGMNMNSNVGFYSYYNSWSGTSNNLTQILPKVTFTYESSMPKTEMPTINVVTNADGSKTITATGNGTVHLYVDGVEVSNPYTIMPSADGDVTVTVTATAQEDGKRISDPATQTVTIPEVGRSPMPVITYVEHNGYVEIIATGEGTITLEAGGQTAGGVGSASIIIVRSPEEQTVTATATAREEGLAESRPATEEITIHALSTTPTAQTKEGLLRLHMLIVDQMLENIPNDNSHPDRYGYVLRYEPNGADGEGARESGTVDVRIQKADCEVMGAYTLTEVDNDKNIGRNHDEGIKMQVITADVAYDLSSTNDMLWEYILQGAENRLPNYNQDYLTRLQKTQNFTYVEMLDGAPDKGHEYPNGEHHYFSAYNPVTGVFNADDLVTGAYGSDYMTYAPSVSTWGVERRYFEDDGLDNTYGAPYWKTSAGKVTMDDSELFAERQINKNNSVNWTTAAGPASLYILDGVKAVGLLPHTDKATVQYEPYMFRIFVESPSGKLRPYKVIEAVEGSTTEGEHLEALVPDNQLTEAQKYGPISIWESYIKYDEDGNIIGDDAVNGVQITTAPDVQYQDQTAYTFVKNKVDRPDGYSDNDNPLGPWDQDNNNAMFGALNAISPETGTISTDDLKVFVRFYYMVKGWNANSMSLRAGEGEGEGEGDEARPGNGAESGGGAAGVATAVNEVHYLGEIVSQTYYNVQGMVSDKPFDGVNIVVTRFGNGTTSVSKIVR